MSDPLVLTDVEKQYGGLRPLRVRDLRVPAGRITMLLGFDRPAAEVFVNLITGASLPDKGEVASLGRPTSAIADSDEWLAFVERFGIVSDRIVLLEAMTVAQNLAISFDLELEPVPPEIMTRVDALAGRSGHRRRQLSTPASPTPRRCCARRSFLRARWRSIPPSWCWSIRRRTCRRTRRRRSPRSSAGCPSSRSLTTIGLLMDEKFAKATGGRLLTWQPATGEVNERVLAAAFLVRSTSERSP